jgi:hypothetical protein
LSNLWIRDQIHTNAAVLDIETANAYGADRGRNRSRKASSGRDGREVDAGTKVPLLKTEALPLDHLERRRRY